MKNLYIRILFLLISMPCTVAFSQVGEWTWIHGSNVPSSPGSYGTVGISDPSNQPPAVYEPFEWTDQSGKFWMFGGRASNGDFMNAMWRYDPVTNEWTWINGLNTPNDPGNYGVQGVSSPLNRPPQRGWAAASWTDLNNNMWMFGGDFGSFGGYNDLWKYDMVTGEWTWMKGSSGTAAPGVYGVQGVPSAFNTPGARWECAAAWTDSVGDLWLFGGYNSLPFNDLWRYSISTNEWTWMKGSSATGAIGIYGTQGVEDPANTPGSRTSYCRWKDPDGYLWLFTGDYSTHVNDMWRYNTGTNNWAWMSGSSTGGGQIGLYGAKCTQFPAAAPGGRSENRACWSDTSGNLWTFGGSGANGLYNDLWAYCTITNTWKWISGDSTFNAPGNWGSLGVSSPNNKPDARAGAVSWRDNSGHLYLFGGSAVPFASTAMNDLWKFTIDPGCVACALPIAIFTAPNDICPGTCTDFVNLSINATSYEWIFPGATPPNSTDENPTSICYNVPGVYDITLIASSSFGTDTLTLPNYIQVYPFSPPQSIQQQGDTLISNTGFQTYQWYFNGTLIPGATQYFYVATQSGNYNVLCTDDNDCEVEAVIFNVVAEVGSISGESGQVEVFPNPAGDELIVRSDLIQGKSTRLSISNSLGETVHQELMRTSGSRQHTIDIQGLTPGVYYLVLQDGKQTVRMRFVRE